VGFAIINRDGYPEAAATWSAGSSAPRAIRELELQLERGVSRYIGAMQVLVLPVPDWEQRASIERGCIALLSNFGREPVDLPSAGWLGQHARHPAIKRSGLWNVNHVGEPPTPDVLDLVEAHLS
jgi:hypothetical protein